MFTGIVTARGRVVYPAAGEGGALRVASPPGWGGLAVGASVAVNGCCLTVTGLGGGHFEATVMPETLRRTNLGRLLPGAAVNLEAPLEVGGSLGGHLVQGHVDGTAQVLGMDPEGEARWLTVLLPATLGRYCVPQGSIALDGCSLTVAGLAGDGAGGATVRVSLVAHTLGHTIAGGYRPGDAVNVEVDLLAKLVERLAAPYLAGPGTDAPR